MEESGYRMVRYADDFVILCRTEDEAMAALRQAEAWVTENGLTLHPDKTRIGDSRHPGQGFDFLGYRFEAGYRFVRKKSRNAFKDLPPAKAGDKVRAKTGRGRGVSLGRIITDLNPMLRGWFGYFQYVVPSELHALDGFIRRRLRAVLRKQEKRPGFAKPRRPSTLAQRFLRGAWTVHLNYSPLSRETLPMRNPTTGEPCAGNRTHGSEGGEAQSLPYPYRLPSRRGEPLSKTWVAGPSRTKSGHGDPLWLHRIVTSQPPSIPRTALRWRERVG
jgi:RNA-directed DNA polymerase